MSARRTPRRFEHARGERHKQRAFISLSGASGGGKTKSALELAQGLVSVTGGKVFGVDTENGRMLKYAPPGGAAASPMEAGPAGKTYAFEHVDFQPPFDPDSYLDALRHCEENGAGCVIFDSMSHEHAGEGGRLDSHDKIAGDNSKKNYAAWRPNTDGRNRLLWGGFMRSPCHIILCFRAKDKTEQRGSAIVDMGFTPIGGVDFIFEADAGILFMPQASGVPTWKSQLRGEASGIKLPDEFRGILDDEQAISWRHGQRIGRWLNAGGSIARPSQGTGPASLSAPGVQTSPPSERTLDGGGGSPPLPPSSPPIDQTPSDTFPADMIDYCGARFDPARPRSLDPQLSIARMEEHEVTQYAKALAELIKRAPAEKKRGWIDAQQEDFAALRACVPSWASRLEALTTTDSAPAPQAPPAESDAPGDLGGTGRVANSSAGDF